MCTGQLLTYETTVGSYFDLRAMVWWLERSSCIRKVEGSNPPSGTFVRAVGKGRQRRIKTSKSSLRLQRG